MAACSDSRRTRPSDRRAISASAASFAGDSAEDLRLAPLAAADADILAVTTVHAHATVTTRKSAECLHLASVPGAGSAKVTGTLGFDPFVRASRRSA